MFFLSITYLETYLSAELAKVVYEISLRSEALIERFSTACSQCIDLRR